TSMLDQTDHQAAEAAQRALNEDLEKRVTERTAELTRMVQTLQATQSELVEAEKLASLGAMVAGISHELNTPLGVAVTVASTLQDRVADIRSLASTDQLRRSALSNFLSEQEEMAKVLMRSIERAAALVSSFKQVAVDRASERRRTFNLVQLVDDIITSVQPGMDKTRLTITHTVGSSIVCDTLPGPIGQVLTNLLQNAKVHAFEGRATGHIRIDSEVMGVGAAAQVVLRIQDDGTGMTEHVRRHAFDPFFTTRLGQGGSGLGLSVSHQLAKVTLGGNLSVESTPGLGSCFTFSFLQTLS
ncbi:MAG TPA: ATP-binding protein, partial [Rhodoferax sp.]|nr:ATP-binding protein [Rhodoferax sp.]